MKQLIVSGYLLGFLGVLLVLLLVQETSATKFRYTEDIDFDKITREELGKAVDQELRQCE